MTDGTTIEDIPAKEEASTASFKKSGIMGVIITLTVIAGATASYIKLSSKEAPAWAYEDLAMLTKTCPALHQDIDKALDDGFLSYKEAKNLGEKAADMTRSYEASDPMNKARSQLKLKPYPVPPRCSNDRPKDDYGAGNLLYPSYFL